MQLVTTVLCVGLFLSECVNMGYGDSICQDRDDDLDCDPGTEISVYGVNFWRINPRECPHPSGTQITTMCTEDPVAANNLAVLQTNCDGKQACTVENSLFENRCEDDAYAYLEYFYLCNDIDECTNPRGNPCGSNSICTNTHGSFDCTCETGYINDPRGDAGFNCVDINECTQPSGNPCGSHSTCTNTPGSYYCICETGYTGDANGKNCLPNPCNPNPCKHNGRCRLTTDTRGYECICPEGYSGDKCEDTPCIPNPCKNNGICSIATNKRKYTCDCPVPFTGKTCANGGQACSKTRPLGMASGAIPDKRITASSWKSEVDKGPQRRPELARLNNDWYWAEYMWKKPWIQVDIGSKVEVAGIITQGDYSPKWRYWIGSLQVQTGKTVDTLEFIKDSSGAKKTFKANPSSTQEATITFPEPVLARYVRITPKECWRERPGLGKDSHTCVLKMEILGCV